MSFVSRMVPCGSSLPCCSYYASTPPTPPARKHMVGGKRWGGGSYRSIEKFARRYICHRLSLLTTVPHSSLWGLRTHCVMGWRGSGRRGEAGVPVGTGASGGVPAVSLYSSSLPSSKAASCLLLSFLSPALPEATKLSALPRPHPLL